MKPLFLLIAFFSFYDYPNVHAAIPSSGMQITSTDMTDQDASGESVIYFKANGVDPVWTLTISPFQVEFKTQASGFPTFTAPHTEPIKAMDSNVKKYKFHTEAGEMEIELAQMLCQNEGSHERFPYSVTVSIRQGVDTTFTYFTGCGRYITDARLDGMWVLSMIKSDSVTASQFNDTLPYIEMHSNGNMFSGYSGCNKMDGRLYCERDLLRFTNMVLSKRVCTTKAKEDEFVKALQFSTRYVIEGDRLILSNPGSQTLVFRKPG
jgi:heat shock protein HslJ